MKKKLLVIIAVILLIAGGITCAVLIPKLEYAKDEGDTEELYRKNVDLVAYDNTIENAIPQTELYNIIKAHFEGELPEGKAVKKAIIIGYDGCRADVLKEIVDGDSGIDRLTDGGAQKLLSYCGGVNYPAVNTQDTSTAPGWCSVLTGVWATEHGIVANDITKSMEYKTLLTSLVEDEIIDSSSFITKWKGHFDRNNATYLAEKDYCIKNNLKVAFNTCKDDEASLEFTLDEIKKSDCADFLFVIYEPTDSTGHNYGFTINNPRYVDAFHTADNYGLQTIKAIEARETFDTEDWLIIITSDHGGIGTEHGDASIQERMTFIVMNKDFNTDDSETPNKEEDSETPKETQTFVVNEQVTSQSFGNSARPTETTTVDSRVYVKEIKITKLPDKTTYYTGEEFSPDGAVVTGYFSNGTTADVTYAVTFSNVNTLSAGKKRVTVEYVDDELNLVVAQFYVNVIESETTETETETTIPDITEENTTE